MATPERLIEIIQQLPHYITYYFKAPPIMKRIQIFFLPIVFGLLLSLKACFPLIEIASTQLYNAQLTAALQPMSWDKNPCMTEKVYVKIWGPHQYRELVLPFQLEHSPLGEIRLDVDEMNKQSVDYQNFKIHATLVDIEQKADMRFCSLVIAVTAVNSSLHIHKGIEVEKHRHADRTHSIFPKLQLEQGEQRTFRCDFQFRPDGTIKEMFNNIPYQINDQAGESYFMDIFTSFKVTY